MTKFRHGTFADRQAVPGEQIGNGAKRGAFLAQLGDKIFRGGQFPETLRSGRCKFRDRLADGDGIKCGHIMWTYHVDMVRPGWWTFCGLGNGRPADRAKTFATIDTDICRDMD